MSRVTAQLFTDNVSKDRPGNFSDLLLCTKLEAFFSSLAFLKHIQAFESSSVVVPQLAYLFFICLLSVFTGKFTLYQSMRLIAEKKPGK